MGLVPLQSVEVMHIWDSYMGSEGRLYRRQNQFRFLRTSERRVIVIHCIRCGAENPDDADICINCCSDLYAPSTSDAEPDAGVDSRVTQNDIVVLEKTTGRIRDRRIAIFLSVLTSVSTLVLLFLWNFDFIAVFRYNIGLDMPDVEMEMTILDSARESGDAVVFSGIVVTSVFALVGFVTPYLSVLTNVIFTLTALESMFPFKMDVGHLPYLCMGTIEQASGVVVIYLVLTAISVIAVFLATRSYSISRSLLDRETRINPKNLFLNNISRDWNVVSLRRIRVQRRI